jgi:hypothetical protein
MVIRIGHSGGVSGAEKKPNGIENSCLTHIATAENDINTIGRMPGQRFDAPEPLDGQMINGRRAHLMFTQVNR